MRACNDVCVQPSHSRPVVSVSFTTLLFPSLSLVLSVRSHPEKSKAVFRLGNIWSTCLVFLHSVPASVQSICCCCCSSLKLAVAVDVVIGIVRRSVAAVVVVLTV